MCENGFWKVCEALDNPRRIALLRYLLAIEKTAFPCVIEIADTFDLGISATSTYLKKLADAGLVSSKRAEKRVYYRAFPTTAEGVSIVGVFRTFFDSKPNDARLQRLQRYVHALSHERRNALVRCLAAHPTLPLKELAMRTDMPYPTAVRLLGELNKANIVDMSLVVVPPGSEPEGTLLKLTVG